MPTAPRQSAAASADRSARALESAVAAGTRQAERALANVGDGIAADVRVRLSSPAFPSQPHALRHTAVAHWIAAGVIDKFELKTYAGHRSIETIDRIYGHLLPRDASKQRDAMSAMRAAARAAAEARPEAAEVVALSDRRR